MKKESAAARPTGRKNAATGAKKTTRATGRKTVKPTGQKAAPRKKKPAGPPPPPPLSVLLVGSECVPFAKAGGLGDVMGALPKALRALGHRVCVVLPLYQQIDRERWNITPDGSCCVHMGGGVEHWAGIWAASLDDGTPAWFVDFADYFDRPGLYDTPAGEYRDNAFRYALLSKAAMQLCKDRDFIPDVIHCHDWPTALCTVFLKTWDRILSPLSKTASVLTIHNIGYQGVYDANAFPYIGVGEHHFNPDVFEDHGRINLLKAGVHFADAITTVSPTHAREILDPVGGQGLAGYLARRSGDIFGILNGADYEVWNPAHDPFLPQTYTPDDLAGKALCKKSMQGRFGLMLRDDVPVFGVVTRFAPQKGMNLLREILPGVLNQMDIQIVVLGTGDEELQHFFQWLSWAYPGRAGTYIGFSVELSHLIEAGCDFFLMPSLYEPCGLNQIYSMKYGTLPIVRATGGLEDTVQNYNEQTGEGTGFKFADPTASALYNTIGWAVSTWYDRPAHIAGMRRNAMSMDFSWNDSANAYVEVYRHAMRNRQNQ